MKIVFVSAEVSPYSKSGGLADVAGTLPKEFVKMGHEVVVITPKYKSIKQPMEYVEDFNIQMNDRKFDAIIRKHEQSVEDKKLTTYFVDNAYYFNRDGMYCHPDEAERFAFFDKAVCKIVDEIKPDILHLNDWQTGPIAVLLRDVYKNHKTKIIYTIHNMEYDGRFEAGNICHLGLNYEQYINPDKLEFYGDLSFSKAGILYADIVTTVSKTYANEIQTKEYSFGYDGLIKMKKTQNKLVGIVNGIDYDTFNPEKDEALYVNYNSETIENKKKNKAKLQEELGLPIKDVPMLAIISRVVHHKGFDILIESLKELLKEDIQFVLLGLGEEHYINRFHMLEEKFHDKVSVNNVFDANLAKRIYAASDIFMMPSLFEPCGLSQLISFRYGTVPIARKTGGLNDTVIGYLGNKEEGNGFTFWNPREEDLEEVTRKALEIYKDKDAWTALSKKIMKLDYSWKTSAEKYIEIYKRVW